MVLRVAVLLALACAAGCRTGRTLSDDLLRGMVGKEVVAKERPQEAYLHCGGIPPPGMVDWRDGRKVYRGILAGFDDEHLWLKPLAHWPKTFILGPMVFSNMETGEESIVQEPTNYATGKGLWRNRIEEVQVVGPAEPETRAQPDTPAPSR